MAALYAPPFPPPLQIEPPPTVNNLRAQIEHWVLYHFLRTVESNVHYEHHLYGQFNVFLSSIFPLRRRYMVIPQALLRRALHEEDVAEDLANVSIGSTGALHEARHIPGTEIHKQFPDFVVVKVTPQAGTHRDHYIVGIIELKRSGNTDGQADRQMRRYMRQAAGLPSRVENLVGFLITGNRVSKYRLEDSGQGMEAYKDGRAFPILDSDDRLTRELCQISVNSRNYQA